MLLIGAVRRERLCRTDERGRKTGFADQVLETLQTGERRGALMREMVHAAHIVHRVVDGGRRDVHAIRLPQGLRQNFRRERGLGRIWLQLTVRLVLGGRVRDKIRDHHTVDVALD